MPELFFCSIVVMFKKQPRTHMCDWKHTCLTENTRVLPKTHLCYWEHTCVTENTPVWPRTHVFYRKQTCVTESTPVLLRIHLCDWEHTCLADDTLLSKQISHEFINSTTYVLIKMFSYKCNLLYFGI